MMTKLYTKKIVKIPFRFHMIDFLLGEEKNRAEKKNSLNIAIFPEFSFIIPGPPFSKIYRVSS